MDKQGEGPSGRGGELLSGLINMGSEEKRKARGGKEKRDHSVADGGPNLLA